MHVYIIRIDLYYIYYLTNTMSYIHSNYPNRAISMFRTSYSFVALSRAAVPDQLAMIWYGQYNPASCSYAPFYLAADTLPATYTT